MSKGIILTPTQIKAYESGATMFLFLIVFDDEGSYTKANFGATLCDNPNANECENYGMTWGCDMDCPVLNRGECELQYSDNSNLIIEMFFPIQAGDKDIFVQEEFCYVDDWEIKESKLTQERLKLLFSYDKNTGMFTRKTNKGRALKGAMAGNINSHGYMLIQIDGYSYKCHRLAWMYEYGNFPIGQIDHKDQDKTNNRIENLRVVTNTKNQQNMPIRSDNSSGFAGVKWYENNKKWKCQITVNGKQIHLGWFLHKEDAIEARMSANVKYGFSPNHGKFSQMTKEQSRYSFKKCIDVKIVRVQDIKMKEWQKIGTCLFDSKDFYNQQMQEQNINRTYEDNDYVFLVEFIR